MNTAKLLGTIGLAVAGFGGAAFLYTQAQAIDNTKLERAASLVQSLQGLDSRWSVELLKVSSNPQAHFDGLAAISPEVTRNASELKKIARKDPSVPSELSASTMSYISLLNSKAERVERFKSAYAIVRNSERYLPVAAQLVSARAGEFKQVALDRSVQTYHTDLKNYFVSPSEIEKQRLMANLNELRAKRNDYPRALRSALGNFLAHGLVLMAQKGPLNELSRSATNAETTSIAESLLDDIKSVISVRAADRSRFEQFSMGLAFLTVIALVVTVAFTRRVAPTVTQGTAVTTLAPQQPGMSLGTSEDPTLSNGQPPGAPTDLDATVVAQPQMQAPQPQAPQSTTAAQPAMAAPQMTQAAPVASAPLQEVVSADVEERIRTEFLAQLVGATSRRLTSHIRMMREVYAEVSKGVQECQASLVVGDTRSANTAIIDAKATLGELSDLLDLNSVPKLVDATKRTAETVARASTGFHDSMKSVIESEKAAFDVVQALESALHSEGPDDTGIAVSKSLVPVHDVSGSKEEMAAAFRCIIDNAREELISSDNLGVVKIQTLEELGAISITFTDNGQGMEPEIKQLCTNAFFSTKDDHEGIGLSTAEYIVSKHGGRLTVNSVPGKGTVVRVLLPGVGEQLPPE